MSSEAIQAAFVLHTRAYRNTSLLVELLTEHDGRFTVVARGAKRPKSQLKGLLQPFIPLFAAAKGRHDLKNLVSAELNGQPIRLTGMAMWCGLYLNELLMRVIHVHDPCPTVFSLYQETIRLLSVADEVELELVLRRFEKHLLRALGYGLHIHAEAETGEAVQPDAFYRYVPEQGLFLTEVSAQDKQLIFSGKSLLMIAEDDFSNDESLQAAKRLFRLAFLPLIGSKPLQTPRMVMKNA